MDTNRRSLQETEPPCCPKCHIDMSWSQSKLVAGEPENFIVHQFYCSNCGHIAQIKTKVGPSDLPPGTKLSAPRLRLVA